MYYRTKRLERKFLFRLSGGLSPLRHNFSFVFGVILFVVVTYAVFECLIFLRFKDFTYLHFSRIAVFCLPIILILVFKSLFSVF